MPDIGTGVMAGSALLGAMGGNDSQTVTQQTQLPDFLRSYGPLYAQAGWSLFNQPYSPYPYETVAPFTQDQLSAMDAVRKRAQAGSPLVNAAQAEQQATIGGQYLNPSTNPYLQQTYDQAAGRMADAFSRGTAAQTDATFARAGAFGGSAWNEMQGANQRALGDSLAGLAANLYGGNYNAERARQQQASQFAPNLAAQDYRDAEALLNVGGMQQQLGQQYLTDDYQRFQHAQQYPYTQFQTLGAMFSPNFGMQNSQTTPGVGAGMGALGGALGGLGLYGMGQKSGLWGGSGGSGLLGSATAPTPTNYTPGQLGSGTYGIWG